MVEGDRRVQLGIQECELTEVAAALDDAFTGYPVAISFSAESLRRMVSDDGVITGACVLARGREDRLLGVCLVALRGGRGRLAAMGVRREEHRTGLGTVLGRAVLSALVDAGAHEVVLEALTVNLAALALYERGLGFARRGRLVGFIREPGGEPIASSSWEQAMAAPGEPDSWQLRDVVDAARERTDLVRVPAVVPERHAVADLLRESGFGEAPIDQYELGRSLPR